MAKIRLFCCCQVMNVDRVTSYYLRYAHHIASYHNTTQYIKLLPYLSLKLLRLRAVQETAYGDSDLTQARPPEHNTVTRRFFRSKVGVPRNGIVSVSRHPTSMRREGS